MDALHMGRVNMERFEDGDFVDGTLVLAKAQAYAAIAQAEAMERIAVHLGNIHQTLMTPNADREPITVADLLKRITNVLEESHS